MYNSEVVWVYLYRMQCCQTRWRSPTGYSHRTSLAAKIRVSPNRMRSAFSELNTFLECAALGRPYRTLDIQSTERSLPSSRGSSTKPAIPCFRKTDDRTRVPQRWRFHASVSSAKIDYRRRTSPPCRSPGKVKIS